MRQRHKSGRVTNSGAVGGRAIVAGVVPPPGSRVYRAQNAAALCMRAKPQLEYLRTFVFPPGKVSGSTFVIANIGGGKLESELVKLLRESALDASAGLDCAIRICAGSCTECGERPMVVRARSLPGLALAREGVCAVLRTTIQRELEGDPRLMELV